MDQDEAREWLAQRLRSLNTPPSPQGGDPLDGLTHCPTCGHSITDDLRPLNAGEAVALMDLYERAPNGEVVHASRFWQSHEGSQLQWWGLIAPDSRGRSGHYSITGAGVMFRQDQLRVAKFARLRYSRNARKKVFVRLLEDDSDKGRMRVGIRDVLPYDYDEYMAARAPHLRIVPPA